MNEAKITFAILLVAILNQQASAQLSFSLDLSLYPKVYNPIPLRDSIPSALVKNSPTNVVITAAPVVFQKALTTPPVATSTTSAAVSNNPSMPTEPSLKLVHPELALAGKPGEIVVKAYVSPKKIDLATVKILPVGPKKIVFDSKKDLAPPNVQALQVPDAPKLKQDHAEVGALVEMSPDEYKMIQALLLLENQKKYDAAMSLLIDLMNNSKLKTQATFHYAQVALHFDLKTEYKNKMFVVMKNTDEPGLRKKAIESLTANGAALEPEDTAIIDDEIAKLGIKPEISDAYLLKKGKYLLSQGDLSGAQLSLGQIGQNSKLLVEARLLLSNANYRGGDLNSAVKNIESIIPKLSSDRTEKFRNLSFLTLARLYFQKGNYKQSYSYYLQIDKSSSFWLQSASEQALTQIMAGDFIGAAGNMFSLHTEYFKKAYSPDSYIIRAVGYLNLCQYGDAVSVVADLQRRYTKFNEQIQNYRAAAHGNEDYYSLVKELFIQQGSGDINGVPRPFIIELARHPSFISVQKKINAFEDELSHFTAVATGLSNQAGSIRQNIAATKADIQNLKSKNASPLQIEQLQRKTLGLESELAISMTGKEKIEHMRSLANERIVAEKTKIKTIAGDVLQKRFAQAQKDLSDVLDQKDILAYEIYSGAGEHLRYQMAGGETKERNPATALTPEEKQSYKWKFKGEVWEDEIGHYRSSLTNVCAKDDFAKNTGGQ